VPVAVDIGYLQRFERNVYSKNISVGKADCQTDSDGSAAGSDIGDNGMFVSACKGGSFFNQMFRFRSGDENMLIYINIQPEKLFASCNIGCRFTVKPPLNE
jgi:hypothetical protein